MKTHLDAAFPAPEFDKKISQWLVDWTPDPHDFGGPPRRVGILVNQNGVSTVYRAIDGDGVSEIHAVYEFLESIGLVDLQIYNHPRFNCIYGLAEHRLPIGGAFTVTALNTISRG